MLDSSPPDPPLRALAAITAATSAVLQAHTEDDLYDRFCTLLVEPGGYLLAWVGRVEHDEARSIRTVASAGRDDGYLRDARFSWNDGPRGAGPTGRAVRSGCPSVLNSLIDDANFEPWRTAATDRGFQSSIALPIMVHDVVVATLQAYASRADAFDDTEQSLLIQLTGTLSHAVSALRDARARELALISAQASYDQLSTVFQTSPDPILVLDRAGRVLHANGHAAAVWERSADELRGPDSRPFPSLGTRPTRAWTAISDALASGGAEFMWSTRRDRGTGVPVEVRLRRLPGPPPTSDRVPALVAVLRDQSDRIRLEREQLRAERLRSLGVLAGGIAHDFNNLLTGILGNISLARLEVEDGDNPDRLLVEAERAGAQAQTLTRQLLTFAKGGEPRRQRIEIGPLVEECASFVLRGSSVRADVVLDDALPPVDGDPDQLSQVLHNLLRNAAQAMPSGGVVRVHVDAPQHPTDSNLHPGPGAWVRVRILDEGAGISPALLEQVFDPFFTTRPTGSGLGLSIVFTVVRRHGGAVRLLPGETGGTCAEVMLPATDAAPNIPVAPVESQSGVVHVHARALVMDDDSLVGTIARRVLGRLGLDTVVLRDGSLAVDAIVNAEALGEPFDIALLDLTIPGGMGGAEAAPKLRAADPALWLVASSGYAHSPVMADPLAAGFDDALPKPWSLPDVLELLQRTLLSDRSDRHTQKTTES